MKLSLGTSSSAPRSLQKRKGGGGKGGGGGGGAKGGGGGGAKGGGGGFTGRSNSTPLKSSGIGSSGTVYGGGGGARRTVDSGAPFAGREYGGGTRDSTCDSLHRFPPDTRMADQAGCTVGTSRYGSGYPYGGVGGTFVSARPFPFGYWPLFWGVGAGGYYGHSVVSIAYTQAYICVSDLLHPPVRPTRQLLPPRRNSSNSRHP